MERELSGIPQRPRHRPVVQSPYRTVHEAAEFLRLSPQTMNNMRCKGCLLYTSPSPRDRQKSRMPSSA